MTLILICYRVYISFVTTRGSSLRNNLVCRRCRNWANFHNVKVTWQKFAGIVCLLWRFESKKFKELDMRFIWVHNQIVSEFKFRFKSSENKKRIACTLSNFRRPIEEELKMLLFFLIELVVTNDGHISIFQQQFFLKKQKLIFSAFN